MGCGARYDNAIRQTIEAKLLTLEPDQRNQLPQPPDCKRARLKTGEIVHLQDAIFSAQSVEVCHKTV